MTQINHHGFLITVLDNGKWYINAKIMTDKRGGAREGAGAPKQPETKVITFRLRLNEIEFIRQVVKKEVAKLREKK